MLNKPLLSVVVPGYNVEEYIAESLDSLANQTFKDFEVIMVDDGSPDGTGAIMDQYAAKYDNFIAVHNENVGLSAARNSGLTHCSGDFVAFVDSDDLVPENAYQLMMGALQKSGSDVATGAVRRFNSKKEFNSALHKNGIKDTVLHTNLHEHPELVYDTTSWNKIYRRTLLVEHQIEFPVGLYYEDIAYVLEAFLNADGIDIIEQPVYKWRMREGDNLSITQRRNSLKLFEHRMIAVRKALSLARKYGYDELVDMISVKALEVDLILFVPDSENADFDYLVEFQKRAYSFMQELDYKRYIGKVTPQKQARLWALLYGDIDSMVNYFGKGNWGTRLVKRGSELVLDHNSFAGKEWPKMIDVTESLPLVSKIRKINQISESHYQLDTAVYPKFSKDITRRNEDIHAYLVNVSTGEELTIPTHRTKTKVVRHLMFKAKVGLSIDLDFDKIAMDLTPGIWKIRVSDQLDNVHSEDFIGGPMKGAGKIVPFTLGKNVVIPEYNFNWELSLRVEAVKNKLNDAVALDNSLVLKGAFTPEVAVVGLQSAELKTTMYEVLSNDGSKIVTDTADSILVGQYTVKLFDKYLNAIDYKVDMAKPYVFDSDGTTQVLSASDVLCATLEKLSGKVTLSKLDGNMVHLDTNVDFSNAKSMTLRLMKKNKSSRYNFDSYTLSNNGVDFDVSFNATGKSLLNAGMYYVYLDVLEDEMKTYRVRTSSKFKESIVKTVGHYVVKSTLDDQGLWAIKATQLWNKLDNSVLKRRVGYSILYPLFRMLPIDKNLVVYDSLWSSAVNDNPRGMYEYLRKNHPELKHAWLLKQTNKIEASASEQVRKNSLRYWYVLARAHYLIENTNLPNQYSKRHGQVEVQTYHGTFMKTMGFDEPHFKFASDRVRDNFKRRINRWDLVVTPSKYMTNKVRSAYGYDGEIIESGYPRNDELISENNSAYISSIKANLGIPVDKKVILYAPTFRQQSGFDLDLDLNKMQQKFGDEYVFLVRLHYFVANSINIEKFKPFAMDVSNYPNINDLYLVADCLITDYSSVMFDFGYLRKPSIYFAYDKETYTGDARGVYLDYDETVPGPIVRTNDELAGVLENLDKLNNEFSKKRDEFYNRFCEFGRTGQAAAEASERMLQISQSESGSEPLIRNKIKRVIKLDKLYPAYLQHVGRKTKKNLIVFESFFGRKFSGDPRSLYEYMKTTHPEYKYVWNVDAESIDYFKRNHIPYVKRSTLGAARVIGRAKYWVTNAELPADISKPNGTKVVQTWHGTPLKTVGRDVQIVGKPNMSADDYHAEAIHDSSRWDYVVAPNAYSATIYKRAFRLREEQIINSGAPRNDDLVNADADKIDEIKRQLNIPSNKKVILYAPSWRENEVVQPDVYKAKLNLDLADMKAKFGNDAVLLIRMHYMITSGLQLEQKDFARDVTGYENISDLYLISDVLITDYSSTLFDFVYLKRPIIFYAYDLNTYGDDSRRFYLDYRNEMPGRIVESKAELYSELRHQLDNPSLSANYDKFVEKYCNWIDGNATKRVSDFLLDRSHQYSSRTLDFSEETKTITEDITIWSHVIGDADYRIVDNVIADGQRIMVNGSAILVDPVLNTDVGKVCYHVKLNEVEGWIDAHDYETLMN